MSEIASRGIDSALRRLDLPRELAADLLTVVETTIDGFAANTLKAAEDTLELASYSLNDSAEARLNRSDSSLNLAYVTVKEEASRLMGYSPAWWDFIVNAIMDIINPLFDAVWGKITEVVGWVTEEIGNAVSGVWNKVTSALNSVRTSVLDFLNGVSLSLGHAATDLEKWAMGSIEQAGDFLSPLGYALSVCYSALINGLNKLLVISADELVKLQLEVARKMRDAQAAEIRAMAGVP